MRAKTLSISIGRFTVATSIGVRLKIESGKTSLPQQ